jgi:hypothetical protein
VFDPVTRPAHYAATGIECIDAIRSALGDEGFMAYCRGNAIKYMWRATRKNNEAQDYAKAGWYAQMAAHVLDPLKHDDPRGGADGGS